MLGRQDLPEPGTQGLSQGTDQGPRQEPGARSQECGMDQRDERGQRRPWAGRCPGRYAGAASNVREDHPRVQTTTPSVREE